MVSRHWTRRGDLANPLAFEGRASPSPATFWLFRFPFIIYQLNIISCAPCVQCHYTIICNSIF